MNGSAYGILLNSSLSLFKLYIKRLNSYNSFNLREFRVKWSTNRVLFFSHSI